VVSVRHIGASEQNREGINLRHARDIIYDLVGETAFGGKGLVHLSVYRAVMHERLPSEVILNHDVVESGLLATATVADAGILDTVPSNRSAFQKRQHRWIRGHWQNLPFLLRVSRVFPRLSLFGKAVLCQNLLDSIVPIALSTAVVICAVSDAAKLIWLTLLLLAPAICNIGIMAYDRARSLDPWQWPETAKMIGFGLAGSLQPAFRALYESVVYSDAIARTMVRLATKRNLLEWESSIVTERGIGGRYQLDLFRIWAVTTAVLLAMVAPLFLRGASIPVLLIALFWIAGSLVP
jgi:cyclic beta-1,2-glucan synthetase